MDKKAMYKLSYGLFVLTAAADGRESGCIVNTAAQVTSEPNRISVAVNKANFTHDLLKKSGRLCVSVISQQATFDLFKRFGFQSGRDVDKFDGFGGCGRTDDGLVYVSEGTNAYITATVEQMIDLGSHTLFIARVDDAAVLSDAPSATYAYYQSSIKPAAPKKSGGKTVWRCTVCGYIYEGEELPADFVCPLCKHPASDFEKTAV